MKILTDIELWISHKILIDKYDTMRVDEEATEYHGILLCSQLDQRILYTRGGHRDN